MELQLKHLESEMRHQFPIHLKFAVKIRVIIFKNDLK